MPLLYHRILTIAMVNSFFLKKSTSILGLRTLKSTSRQAWHENFHVTLFWRANAREHSWIDSSTASRLFETINIPIWSIERALSGKANPEKVYFCGTGAPPALVHHSDMPSLKWVFREIIIVSMYTKRNRTWKETYRAKEMFDKHLNLHYFS